jgi:hypothetical protein
MTLETAASNIDMEIYEYPCTRGELLQVSEEDAKYEELEAETKSSTINIPISENVASAALKNADGGVVEVSPLSIKIDMNTGLGLTESEAYDPYSCYYVSINYKDGTNYIVSEHEKSGKHSCDVEIDNSSYACGSLNNELTYVFNRLVDTSQIESVTVNDVEYTLQ